MPSSPVLCERDLYERLRATRTTPVDELPESLRSLVQQARDVNARREASLSWVREWRQAHPVSEDRYE